MSIEIYGKGERMRHLFRLCSGLYGSHLLLLPIPTTKDGEHLTGTDIRISDAISGVFSDSVAVCYGMPREYKEEILSRGAHLFDLSEDEKFLSENARLSALGALGYILTEYGTDIKGARVGIVGYGRIGSRLLEMLLFLGASVTLYSKRAEVRAELSLNGVETSDAVYRGEVLCEELDLLINTAPTDLSYLFEGGKIGEGLRVVELASGENFGGIEGVVRLPGIPEKLYPESSARLYRGAVSDYLLREGLL